MLDQQYFVEFGGGEFVGQCGDAFADDHGREAAAGLRGNLLRRGQRFKAGLVPLRVALFGNEKDIHRGRLCA